MALRYERMALLAGVESSYGVDVTPTAAVQLKDVTFDIMEGDEVEVDVLRTGMSSKITAFFGRHCSLKGKILLGSSGTAGTAPAWDWLAQATGHAATVTEDTKVEYTPIDTGFKSASTYFNIEGNRTRALGMRGNIIWRWTVGGFPEAEFDLLGLFDADASVSFPSVDYSGWKVPPLFGKAQAPVFQIASNDEVLQSLEINAGISKEYVNRINREDIEIGDRKPTMTAVIQEPAFSTRNYFSAVGIPGTYKTMAMTHGTVGGAKILAAATNWQLGKPSRQKLGNNVGLSLPGRLIPASGVADYKITVM